MNRLLAMFITLLLAVATACSQPSSSPSPTPSSSATASPASALGPSTNLVGRRADIRRPQLGMSAVMRAMNTTPPPAPQPSWRQATWFVDPVKSAACTSDTNKTCSISTCATPGDGPCQHYDQIAARWGTYFPRLRQNTTITFMSSQTDNTDPVIYRPYQENGSQLFVLGQLGVAQQICTSTLGGVTAKNRGTQTLLQATLCAGVAPGTLLVNTTHPSYAMVYKNVAGASWAITQPQATTPGQMISAAPTEVDTWTNTDSYVAYNMVSVYVSDIEPVGETVINGTEWTQFGQMTLLSPAAELSPTTTVSGNVQFVDVNSQREIVVSYGSSLVQKFANVGYTGFNGLLTYGIIAGNTTEQGTYGIVYGGFNAAFLSANNYILDNDTIVGGAGISLGCYRCGIGQVAIDGGVLTVEGGTLESGGHVYGPGGGVLDVFGATRLSYTAGQGTAAFIATTQINGSTTACSHNGAQPDVTECGITISGANLDAAQGAAGFGGLAYRPGGASIASSGL